MAENNLSKIKGKIKDSLFFEILVFRMRMNVVKLK